MFGESGVSHTGKMYTYYKCAAAKKKKTWRVLFAIVSVSSEETVRSRMSMAAMPWT